VVRSGNKIVRTENCTQAQKARTQVLDFSESKKKQKTSEFLACRGAQDHLAAVRQSFAVAARFSKKSEE
jgi:hypothetical protein